MKKLLIALLSIVAVVAVSDVSAFCGRGRCHKPCAKKIECNRGPRVCKTVVTQGECPTEKCVRTVEVDAPCDVTEYIHKTYAVECPNDGFNWTKVPADYVCQR